MQYNASRADCPSERGARRRLDHRDRHLARRPALAAVYSSIQVPLYFGQQGQCRIRYDNERGKGDHRHIAGLEQGYEFVSLAKLFDDFEHDVETWREP